MCGRNLSTVGLPRVFCPRWSGTLPISEPAWMRGGVRRRVGTVGPMSSRGKRFGLAIGVVVVLVAGILAWQSVENDGGVVDRALSSLGATESFPDVDAAGLTPTRRRIVAVVRHEYDHKQPGEYYAQGVTEPWCADFVSWTMRKAGVPLDNPNSGSWRIPGVATLTEFYRSAGRFRGPNYRPTTGDVVLYQAPNRFKQHTNIVLQVSGETVTTVGGNEPPSSISINSYDLATVTGIVGYGIVAGR